jgi:hypothetical protein
MSTRSSHRCIRCRCLLHAFCGSDVFDSNREIYEGFGTPRDCDCAVKRKRKTTVHEGDIGDGVSAADLFDLTTVRKKKGASVPTFVPPFTSSHSPALQSANSSTRIAEFTSSTSTRSHNKYAKDSATPRSTLMTFSTMPAESASDTSTSTLQNTTKVFSYRRRSKTSSTRHAESSESNSTFLTTHPDESLLLPLDQFLRLNNSPLTSSHLIISQVIRLLQ